MPLYIKYTPKSFILYWLPKNPITITPIIPKSPKINSITPIIPKSPKINNVTPIIPKNTITPIITNTTITPKSPRVNNITTITPKITITPIFPKSPRVSASALTNTGILQSKTYSVPQAVRDEAEISLLMHKNGYNGGTDTGYSRGEQLKNGTVDLDTLRTMRNWFARHIYVSYPGYQKWVTDGRPTEMISGMKNSYRGAVAWLLWGGDAAYNWIKSSEIQSLLNEHYPSKNNSLE